MLTALSIKNYALIEDIKIDLQQGLTIITGETGAGKSIMLGALGLLLGKRADYSVIKKDQNKCVIEGTFKVANYNLKGFFEREDLDYEETTIVRREILASGKSRAFINDTPVTLPVLVKLGDLLIDIHGQHQTLSLGENIYQFQVLDVLAQNRELLTPYKAELRSLRKLEQQLTELKEEQARAIKEHDYNLFLVTELEEAKLKAGMLEELEERFEELNNVEVLTEHLGSALEQVRQEEIGSVATLKNARMALSKISGLSAGYENLYERVQSVIIELDDIEQELENSLDRIEANPEELEEVNAKLQLLYNLQKKHAASTVEELLEITSALREKVDMTENAEANLEKLQKDIQHKKEELSKIAGEIHKQRAGVIPGFTKDVEKIIGDLGMPNARLKIELELQKEFFANGQDQLSWYLSANKGGNFTDIKKAASGGELSRIMLAVKSILATQSKLPTIIFDEIDTGVSGDIAQKMGDILQKMGSSMQVISITHLPQIAGKGSSHFKIFKQDEANTTVTKIRELSTGERIEELAMMLGGDTRSESAMAHARALLN
ncbi:DNA repair protein RecN [Antarcticibacterium flavum]|uniref:DNA repair protein RecN n=1 Tax=Antarcticibacterium flavum TaxID=2058175 RepID=A0A5B7X6Y2_9FLAO|nr:MULTISPECIES: DNA repair protein RecN [Antarcticibacterium]MCM4161061.1 DNA repair protein RecN [Antarcticibacterium sp. W02-3]QCY70512.1 DNA repair protein RecN [Antarcticibacterium flavum]